MIYISSDHNGFKLKKRLVRFLQNELVVDVEDLGPKTFVKDDDYPDYSVLLAKKVIKKKDNYGILLCHNGAGVCLTANKIKGIRAAVGFNITATEQMRADDDINVLCLAADFLTEEHAMAIVKTFLQTPFSRADRHVRRLRKVARIEKNN